MVRPKTRCSRRSRRTDRLHGRDLSGSGRYEATKAAQRAGIEHAKQSSERTYLGRKPSLTREQFIEVRAMLEQQAAGIAQIAKETSLSRQTVYRINGDPAGAEAALVAWGM